MRFIAEVRVLLRKFRVNTRKFSTYQNKSMGLRSLISFFKTNFIKYTVGLPNFCFRSEMYSFDYQIFNYSYEYICDLKTNIYMLLENKKKILLGLMYYVARNVFPAFFATGVRRENQLNAIRMS